MTEVAYDKEAIYDEEIAPLMKQILATCKKHELPFVASFAYGREEDGEVHFCSSAIPHDVDVLRQAVRVLRGEAVAVPASFAMTITDGDKREFMEV